jgi:hypothetical protein
MTFFHILVIQTLVILMRTRCLTIIIGVRAYFLNLINSKYQNDFFARRCRNLSSSSANVIFQKHYQSVKSIHNIL